MFGPYWQYQLPVWAPLFVFLVALLVPLEIGLRLGRRASRSHNPASQNGNDITLTSMLTLLALMLAFTYSFSMSRADLRKASLTNEINAISTAFLRADLLPEPGRTDVRRQLYAYAESRYIAPGSVTTLEEVEQIVERSLEIQSQLWPAVKQAIRQPGEMTAPEKALLVSATNDVLDAHTCRMAVFYDRLPIAVLALLVIIASTSLGFAAFNAARGGHHLRWRLTTFAFVLACLMNLILDFDMMQRGLIQLDFGSQLELIEELRKGLDA